MRKIKNVIKSSVLPTAVSVKLVPQNPQMRFKLGNNFQFGPKSSITFVQREAIVYAPKLASAHKKAMPPLLLSNFSLTLNSKGVWSLVFLLEACRYRHALGYAESSKPLSARLSFFAESGALLNKSESINKLSWFACGTTKPLRLFGEYDPSVHSLANEVEVTLSAFKAVHYVNNARIRPM